jgi:hypothetical protein
MAHGHRCTHCGARLRIPDSEKVVTCEYCGTDNAVADVAAPPYATPRDRAAPRIDVTHSSRSSAPRTIVLILVPMVIVLGAVIAFLVGPLRQGGALGGNSVRGDAKGMVEARSVVPSWEAVDGLQTARNILESMPASWKPSTIRWTRVQPDGTLDIENDAEAMVSLEFYDTARLENVVPGESSAKGARFQLSVIGGYMAGYVSDANLTWVDDIVYLDELPSCDLPTLRKKAAQAGYPDEGYATVTFAEIPYEMSRDRIEFKLGFIRPDGDELVEKFAKMQWDPMRFRYYTYHVPNLDASKLPAHFDPGTCEPVDVEKLVAAEIEKIRTN